VVTNFEKLEHEMEQKQKVLGEMQNNLSKQLSETLALQTASYLQGVFEITGSQKARQGDGGGSAQVGLRADGSLDSLPGETHREVSI
jgi:hypothetical protein